MRPLRYALALTALLGSGDTRPPVSMTDAGSDIHDSGALLEDADSFVCPYEAGLTNCRYNLQDFPDGFLLGNTLDALIVIGAKAPPSVNLAVSDLGVDLAAMGIYIPVGNVVLDSEIQKPSSLYTQNTILVGTPCTNATVREYLGITRDQCADYFGVNDGILAAMEWGNNFKSLLISGNNESVLRPTARFLRGIDVNGYAKRVFSSGNNPTGTEDRDCCNK